MSASYEESNLLSRLAGELSALQTQMQTMTNSSRVDIKEYKRVDKSYKEKVKMYTMLTGGICTRIADKNKD